MFRCKRKSKTIVLFFNKGIVLKLTIKIIYFVKRYGLFDTKKRKERTKYVDYYGMS